MKNNKTKQKYFMKIKKYTLYSIYTLYIHTLKVKTKDFMIDLNKKQQKYDLKVHYQKRQLLAEIFLAYSFIG